MKIALFACLFSLSALADTTCFTRTTEIETTEVSLGRTICFGEVEVQLDLLNESKVLLRYSIDENRGFKTATLRYATPRADGTIAYQVVMESNTAGGFCGDTWEATSNATIVMKRDGTQAKVEALTGETSYSSDNCHSGFQVVQELQYSQI